MNNNIKNEECDCQQPADDAFEEKPKQVPMTFEDLIPLVGTPMRIISGVGIVRFGVLELQNDEGVYFYKDAESEWTHFDFFHDHATRLDGTKFMKEVE